MAKLAKIKFIGLYNEFVYHGGQVTAVIPVIRTVIGNSPNIRDIDLTEENLIDLIQQASGALKAMRTVRIKEQKDGV